MRNLVFLLAAVAVCLPSGLLHAGDDIASAAARDFADPPREYGVNCWWWWLNGNTDKAAITSELAAMKEKKFQGAMIFDAGGHNQRGNGDIPAGPVFGSDEWCGLFAHALDEAEKNGLQMGVNIQSGWNLGGPCVTPEHAAKRLVSSHVDVNGGKGGFALSTLGRNSPTASLAGALRTAGIFSATAWKLRRGLLRRTRRPHIKCASPTS